MQKKHQQERTYFNEFHDVGKKFSINYTTREIKNEHPKLPCRVTFILINDLLITTKCIPETNLRITNVNATNEHFFVKIFL